MTSKLRSAVRKNLDGAVLKQIAMSEGMATMRDSGIQSALSGQTTFEEVCRVLLTDEGHEAIPELALAA